MKRRSGMKHLLAFTLAGAMAWYGESTGAGQAPLLQSDKVIYDRLWKHKFVCREDYVEWMAWRKLNTESIVRISREMLQRGNPQEIESHPGIFLVIDGSRDDCASP